VKALHITLLVGAALVSCNGQTQSPAEPPPPQLEPVPLDPATQGAGGAASGGSAGSGTANASLHAVAATAGGTAGVGGALFKPMAKPHWAKR
jgi:hypothetical protein